MVCNHKRNANTAIIAITTTAITTNNGTCDIIDEYNNKTNTHSKQLLAYKRCQHFGLRQFGGIMNSWHDVSRLQLVFIHLGIKRHPFATNENKSINKNRFSTPPTSLLCVNTELHATFVFRSRTFRRLKV
jgi:hypothetical protein